MVRDSKLKPLRKFAKQVRRYRLNIEAYIRSNLTTANSEGLNYKIRVLTAMAYKLSERGILYAQDPSEVWISQ